MKPGNRNTHQTTKANTRCAESCLVSTVYRPLRRRPPDALLLSLMSVSWPGVSSCVEIGRGIRPELVILKAAALAEGIGISSLHHAPFIATVAISNGDDMFGAAMACSDTIARDVNDLYLGFGSGFSLPMSLRGVYVPVR